MTGGSSASCLARTPCVPLFSTLFNRVETVGLLGFQGTVGIISIVRWNLRPVSQDRASDGGNRVIIIAALAS